MVIDPLGLVFYGLFWFGFGVWFGRVIIPRLVDAWWHARR